MRHALRLLLFSSLSLLFVLPGLAATDFSALEKAVRDDLAATGTPGAAVIVVSGDRVVFAKGFGTSNLEIGETGAPVTLDTLFQVGSVTKLLTGADGADGPDGRPLYLHMALWAFARAAG